MASPPDPITTTDPPSSSTNSSLSNPFHLAHAISNIKSIIPVTLDSQKPNLESFSHHHRRSFLPLRFSPWQNAMTISLKTIGSVVTFSSGHWSTTLSLMTSQAWSCRRLAPPPPRSSGPLLLLFSLTTKTTGPFSLKKNSSPWRRAPCPLMSTVSWSKQPSILSMMLVMPSLASKYFSRRSMAVLSNMARWSIWSRFRTLFPVFYRLILYYRWKSLG